MERQADMWKDELTVPNRNMQGNLQIGVRLCDGWAVAALFVDAQGHGTEHV